MKRVFVTNRRRLLAMAAMLPSGYVVSNCGGEVSTIPTYVSAIQAIGQELIADLPLLATAGLNTGASVTVGGVELTVSGVVTAISTAAGALGSAATVAQGQSTLATIEGYINALAPLLAPFAVAVPGVGIAIAAIPAVEALVNIAVTLLTPQAKALATPAPASAIFGAPAAMDPRIQRLLDHVAKR